MSLFNLRHPFEEDNFFGDFFPTVADTRVSELPRNLMPRVDIEEHDNQVIVKADLPGIKKEDIQVSLNDGLLTIDARHKEESEEKKGGRVLRRERRVGSYTRSWTVAKGITENDIHANFKDGVLTLTLPKVSDAAQQPRRIEIA
jgi:HSP20 family protein